MSPGRWWAASQSSAHTPSPPASPAPPAPAAGGLHLSDGSLIVRLPKTEDIPAVLRFFVENRQPLAPFEPRRPDSFYTAEFWQMRAQQLRIQFEDKRGCGLLVFAADNHTVIGEINFSNYLAYPMHAATLGYALDHRLWGCGRMRAALELALPCAFDHLNLHRVMANHLPDNQRSAALLRRLGFREEGYARDYLLVDGLWRDHVLNALTRQDWQSRDPTRPLLQTPNGLPRPPAPER